MGVDGKRFGNVGHGMSPLGHCHRDKAPLLLIVKMNSSFFKYYFADSAKLRRLLIAVDQRFSQFYCGTP